MTLTSATLLKGRLVGPARDGRDPDVLLQGRRTVRRFCHGQKGRGGAQVGLWGKVRLLSWANGVGQVSDRG